MALRKILHYPNPKLRQIATPVIEINHEIRQLVTDMFETMYEDNGIGLAATQIGIDMQIFVVDVSDEHNNPMAFINPTIIEKSGLQKKQEGCLSVPGIFADIKRAEFVKVEALNQNGEKFITEAYGLLAVCIQHEYDHLLGKLFIDHLSPLKKQLLKKKLKKLHKKNL
jgi:peptide deformylase